MPSAYRHGLATRSTRTMSFDWKAYDLFSLRLMMLWFSTQMWDHGDSTEYLSYEPISAELHCQKHAEASLGPRTPHHKPTMILWHERITGFSLIDACQVSMAIWFLGCRFLSSLQNARATCNLQVLVGTAQKRTIGRAFTRSRNCGGDRRMGYPIEVDTRGH